MKGVSTAVGFCQIPLSYFVLLMPKLFTKFPFEIYEQYDLITSHIYKFNPKYKLIEQLNIEKLGFVWESESLRC